MDEKSKLVLIFILIIGIVGFIYLTTPSLDADNFSVEKYKEITKYESGKVEKDYYVDYGFEVINAKAIDYVSVEVNIYDKHGNQIESDSFTTDAHSQSYYTLNVDKSTYKKACTAELILSDNNKGYELYHTTTSVEKGETVKDYVDDVVDYTPKSSTSSSTSPSSSSDYDSYSSNSEDSVYGDYVGNSNTHKFHQSFCSWADNIKSGNRVSFSSRQDALDSGYSPCGHCNP